MARHKRSPTPEVSEEDSRFDDEPLIEVDQLTGDLSREFRLARPIRVEVWIEQGEFVADAPELNLHAFGADRTEALANLSLRVVEQRHGFQALRGRLSAQMKRDAAQLEAIVLPCDA
jgi:hypothetical protein